jgi:hypothetical protein
VTRDLTEIKLAKKTGKYAENIEKNNRQLEEKISSLNPSIISPVTISEPLRKIRLFINNERSRKSFSKYQ